MLKNDIRDAAENGGLGLLGEGTGESTSDFLNSVKEGAGPGNVSTSDFVNQVMEGAAPQNLSTEDVIHPQVDDSDIQALAEQDGNTYREGFDGATQDVGQGITESIEGADAGALGAVDGGAYKEGFGGATGDVGSDVGDALEEADVGARGGADGGKYGDLFGTAASDALTSSLGEMTDSIFNGGSAEDQGETAGKAAGDGVIMGATAAISQGAGDLATAVGGVTAAASQGAAAMGADLGEALDKAYADYALLVGEMDDLRVPDILAAMPDLNDFDVQLTALGRDLNSLAGPAGVSADALADVGMRITAAGNALDEFEREMPQALQDLADFGAAAGSTGVLLNPDMYANATREMTGAGQEAGDGFIQGATAGIAQGEAGLVSELGTMLGGASEGTEGDGEAAGAGFLQGLTAAMAQGWARAGSMFSGMLGGGAAGDVEEDGEAAGAGFLQGITSAITQGLPKMGQAIAGFIPVIGDTLSEGLSDQPEIAGALAAAVISAAPFVAAAISGVLTSSLGMGLAAMAIYGASHNAEVVGAFDNLKASASADLTQIGTAFVPVVTSILKAADGMLATLTPVFSDAAGIMAGPFEQFADVLIGSFESPQVATSIYAVASAFSKILTSLTPELPQMVNELAGGITAMATAIGKNPQLYADFINFLVDAVADGLHFLAFLTDVAGLMDKAFGPIWDMAADAINTVIELIKALGDLLTGNFSGALNAMAGMWAKIWGSLDSSVKSGIDDAMKSITSFASSLGQAFQVGGSAWASAGSGLVSGFTQAVQAGWQAFTGWLSAVPAGVTEPFQGAGGWLTEAGAGLLAGFLSGAASGWDAASGFLGGIPGDVSGYFSGTGSWLAEAGSGLFGGFLGGVSAGWGDVTSFIGGIPGDVVGFFQGAGSWLLQAGEDIIDGLLSGIVSAWDSVTSFFTGAVSDILGALGIHSPPAWSIGAGEDIGTGFGIGLENMRARLVGTAGSLGDAMAGAMSSRASWAASAGDGITGDAATGTGTGGYGTAATPGSAGGLNVTLEIGSSGNADFDAVMLKWVRQVVRVKGGGSAQKAFGYGSG